MAQSSNEKTEKATAKKRQDARKEGQVLKSGEVNTAVSAIIVFAFVMLTWSGTVDKLIEMVASFLGRGVIETASATAITKDSLDGLYMETLKALARLVLPVLAVAMVAGVVSNIIQVGFLFTTKTLKPKMSRINPIEGFKRIFSMKTLVDLLKSILKVVLLGYILYNDYTALLEEFGGYMAQSDLYGAMVAMMETALRVALKMYLAFAIIAAADFLFQWRKHEKDLMMTKQEIKDEYKNTEGDPQIKNRIRQKQRQMSTMRMMDAVPSADVVITNPTHFAIALRYTQGEDTAPVVVAKGQDYLAKKIKEAAREHGIEIVENKPLAQALYKICEVDSQIPMEFYQAVADILVYVFKRKNPNRRMP